MKKMIALLWLLCLLLCFQTVFADNSGICGKNVQYTISGNTIPGFDNK